MRALYILIFLTTAATTAAPYTGFRIAGLPNASYNDGEGFAAGGNLYFYQYGGGRRSPYVWNTILSFKTSTQGMISSNFFLDVPNVIGNNSRFNLYVEYKRYIVDDFYGLGNAPDVNPDYSDPNAADFQDQFYYSFKQKWPGLVITLQLPFFVPKTRHLFSLAYYNRQLSPYPYPNKFHIDKPVGYAGGITASLQYGLVYDSRDQEAVPQRGVWSEFLAEYAAPVLGSDYEYLRLTVTDRRYFSVTPRLVYAQRLLFEPILGTTPFYDMAVINSSFERQLGLGGAYSLRGIPRNLFLGQHKLLGNFELRLETISITILKQHMTFYLHGFFDTGRVWLKNDPLTFNTLHSSYGVGLHGRWNKDLVGAIDVGRSAYSDLAIYVTFRNLF